MFLVENLKKPCRHVVVFFFVHEYPEQRLSLDFGVGAETRSDSVTVHTVELPPTTPFTQNSTLLPSRVPPF